MQKFLISSKYIDWQHEDIMNIAIELAGDEEDIEAIVNSCFLFVRDEIKHSWDYQMNPVTCKASDVLKYGTGYCYAKSHLLAALLRANAIPAGLCYQRLTIADDRPPFCLHGLNAVFLPQHGWYRMDARGNNDVVTAELSPPQENLAFSVRQSGEADLPEIWPEPLPDVIKTLESYHNYLDVSHHLPDIEVINFIRDE